MKNLIVLCVLVCSVFTLQAQEKQNKNAKHEFTVNGNCDMCKKRIEKAAYSIKGVKQAVWHQDHQDIHLIIDETKCNVMDVHKAIAAAGHDTNLVKAKDEDYEVLHHCCLYERVE